MSANKNILLAIAVISIALLHLTTAANSVGSECTHNDNCTGPNEVCQVADWIDPPCDTGMCVCQSCYTTGDMNTEYGWDSSNDCAAITALDIGDSCSGAYNEVILSINAECSGGVVQCQSGFARYYSVCVRATGLLTEGQTCQTDDDCAGALSCRSTSNGFKCQCFDTRRKFKSSTGECVLKEYGDECSLNSDCDVSGRFWRGLTWNQGTCSSNTCGCESGSGVSVNYVSPQNGQAASKTICVHSGATLNQPSLGTCSRDPIYEGGTSAAKLCGSNLACVTCPEDKAAGSFGKCRQLNGTKPTPTCYTKPPLPVITTTQAPATTSGYNWFASWSDQDFKLAYIVNGSYAYMSNLRACTDASKDCRTHEICLMPNQCGRGICHCPSPNYEWSNACYLPTTSTTTPTTTSTTTTTTSTTTTTTTSTTTTTTTSTSTSTATTTSTTTTTTTTLPRMFYYSICQGDWECSRVGLGVAGYDPAVGNGLQCKSNGTGGTDYCLCVSDNWMWKESLQRCVLRDYGDPCKKDSDCNNGIYTKLNAGGYKCLSSKTCGCSTTFSDVIVAGLSAAWGATIPSYVQGPAYNRTFCVLKEELTDNVQAKGDCTIPILDRSNQATKVCERGLVCLACPLDTYNNQNQFGSCVKFEFASSTGSGGSGSGSGSGAEKSATSSLLMLTIAVSVASLSMLL